MVLQLSVTQSGQYKVAQMRGSGDEDQVVWEAILSRTSALVRLTESERKRLKETGEDAP